MRLHVMIVNLIEGEVEFDIDEAPEFRSINEMELYMDIFHPDWTSLIVTATPEPKLVEIN